MVPMDIEISTDPARLDVDVIHRFLAEESYWARGRTREVVERTIAHSLCFGVYLGERQVGYARVVSDFATFAWLADVFILDEFRGRGYGKTLIQAVVDHPDLRGLRRIFLATLDAHGLYEQSGFVHVTPGRFMERFNPDVQ
ncbi:Nitrate/nitrite transport system permease [Candidatus Promineifilum breve]|uniref:Nitrate/nitrite transport system permease n=2 Tax=Candidatus Promineifilum breve TaxID=1806508 RepID=A0A160T4S3_9CHLR|nr:Nitrate/nitrite transport system permease [Candidatus Promineifilum breve]